MFIIIHYAIFIALYIHLIYIKFDNMNILRRRVRKDALSKMINVSLLHAMTVPGFVPSAGGNTLADEFAVKSRTACLTSG